MIHCEGRYGSLGQSLCFVFNLCMHILYSEYIVYITCYFCVTWLCIAWLVYSFHPTRVCGFGTRLPKWPTGVFIVQSPRFCHQLASPLAGWWPHGLNTHTPSSTLVSELSARHRGYAKNTQQTKNTTDEHLRPQSYSNPQFQQLRDFRHMPYIPRPPEWNRCVLFTHNYSLPLSSIHYL